MNQPINHHYLPVFYLRRWCNADGKVVRYYRPHTKVVAAPISPASTGYEPFLYSLPGHPPGKEQVAEKELMAPAVDEPASLALNVLIARDWSKLTVDMRVAWTRFLMSMRLRDPHSLAEVSALARSVLKANLLKDPEEYLSERKEYDPPALFGWIEKNAPHVLETVGKLFLPGLIDHEEVGNHIIKHAMGKLRSVGEQRFIAYV
jgi:hypothetical protein